MNINFMNKNNKELGCSKCPSLDFCITCKCKRPPIDKCYIKYLEEMLKLKPQEVEITVRITPQIIEALEKAEELIDEYDTGGMAYIEIRDFLNDIREKAFDKKLKF